MAKSARLAASPSLNLCESILHDCSKDLAARVVVRWHELGLRPDIIHRDPIAVRLRLDLYRRTDVDLLAFVLDLQLGPVHLPRRSRGFCIVERDL